MTTCQWCGQPILSSGMWKIDGEGRFCSERCCNEWEREHLGKENARREEEARKEERAWELSQQELREKRAAIEAEQEHFRPFIEQRIGRPLQLYEVWWNERLNTWVAKEEFLAEAGAALKALEKETGVPVSVLCPLERLASSALDRSVVYITWKNNRWNFASRHWTSGYYNWAALSNDGDPYIPFSPKNTSDGDWWSDAASLSPLIALAAYEGKKVQDVTDSGEYAFVEPCSCLISETELKQKLERPYLNSIDFSPAQNLFFYDGSELKKGLLSRKYHSKTIHREVRLDELKIRIPVKKIVPPAVSNETMAEDYYRQGSFAENADEAIALFTKVIALNPNFVRAYYKRGSRYLKGKKDHDKAIADFTQAVKLDPNNNDYKEWLATSYNDRGIVRYNNKDFDKAIADFTQATRFNPNDAVIKKNLEAVKAAQAAQAPRSAPAASAERVCPQCGAALKAAARFCGSCGAKFEAQPAGKFCPNCGNPVSATAKFCGNCRTKVS